MKCLSSLVATLALVLAAGACAPTPPPSARSSSTEPGSSPALAAETDLHTLLGSGEEVTVAGRKLNAARLRTFYAPLGFAPVWTTRRWQAEGLTEAIFRAGDHGLAPDAFHAAALRDAAGLPPLERELLLSDGVLAYAESLARGAVPVERRRSDETLTPGPVDVAFELRMALASADPPSAIEALAPATPTYRALRQALRDLPDTGDTARRQTILVNLERERWLPRRLPAERVWVNIPDQRLTFYRDESPALSTRVIVGRTERPNQTPELEVMNDAIWFNPPWNVPDDIADKMLPKAKADPKYLARNNLVVQPDGRLQQRAGPGSGLASLLFDMNNRFDVYLHDTPSRQLFQRDDRRISHGCVRVEEPRKLAALVMQVPVEEIDRRIATGETARTPVPKPVPVFLVYQTAFADTDGKLQFRPDIYGRDAEIARLLAAPPLVVAQRQAPLN